MSLTVQSFWIGNKISAMEELSIKSFLQNGYGVDVYLYDDIENLPDGVTIKDATEIIARSDYERSVEACKWSPVKVSNWFRYALLDQKGGWWIDLDVVCLRPWTYDPEYVVVGEQARGGKTVAGTGVLKMPKGCELAKELLAFCDNIVKNGETRNDTGPPLMQRTLRSMKMEDIIVPWYFYSPVAWFAVGQIVNRRPNNIPISVLEQGFAIHLWNDMWRKKRYNRNAQHPESLYAYLRERYGVEPTTSNECSDL